MKSTSELGIRWLTALIIITVAGLAVYRGLDIIRFSLADSVVDPKLGPTADQVAAIDGWRATSGTYLFMPETRS